MFGPRTLGQGAQVRSRLQAEGVGTIAGNSRLQNFLRGSRRPGQFVGADRSDVQRFVGATRATTSTYVRSAAESFRLERQRTNLRQFYQPWQSRMYEPRLQVAFSFTAPPPTDRIATLSHRLTAAVSADPANPIEVVLEGETAILRGVVVSDRARSLAERLALLEPGVAEVKNELVVGASERPTATPKSPPGNRPQAAAPQNRSVGPQSRPTPSQTAPKPTAEQ